MTSNPNEAAMLIQMEQDALARWIEGDPAGFLEIIVSDYTYFDPFVEKRVDGYDGIEALYKQIAEQIHADHKRMFDPRVQLFGDTAILTFQFRAWNQDESEPTRPIWNTTEVFHRYPDGWKLVHTHWAFTKAEN